MRPTIANIRCTIFTSKPVEIDYDKSMKIASSLHSYQLFTFPVNGFSFQIGPGGMIPATLTSYEFRNNDNSLNISMGPDRIDINNCRVYSDIREAFSQIISIYNDVLSAFNNCVEFKIVRLALASVWNIADTNMNEISTKILSQSLNPNLIEWTNHRVERKPLPSSGILVNYGNKLARGAMKLPIEQTLKDRIYFETDVNTIPLSPDVLNDVKSSEFFANAIDESVLLVSDIFNQIGL